MEEKRTLIEKFLPIEEISAEGKKEKLGTAKPPTFELHYWWTRKPLLVSRSTIMGALLPDTFDITEFKHLIGLRDNQKIRAHNYDLSNSKLNLLKESYKQMWGTDYPTILDPFGGGGSIPFEAIRANVNTISNDYNPVAHLIQKATIEYPLRYGEDLLKEVDKGLNWIFEKTKEDLKIFFPKHNGKDVAAYMYSWIVCCPECGFKNPLVGQWWLVKKAKKKIFLDPHIEGNKLKFAIKKGENAPPGTVTRGKGKCLKCGSLIPNEHIVQEINQKEEEMLLAVVLLGKKGKSYDIPNESDKDALELAKKTFENEKNTFLKKDLIPIEEMPQGDILCAKYLRYWYRILNFRQLILFSTLIENIREYTDHLDFEKDYKTAIATYLSFILGKHIDYNCRSTKWNRSYEVISSTTSVRRPSMQWDHMEVNPFVKSSGTLVSANRTILRSLQYSVEKLKENVSVKTINHSILELDEKIPIIITDPPYFDDVQYAELSELFYVFEKRALKNLIELPKDAPKAEDLSVGKRRKNEVFEHLFNLSCDKLNSMLTENGILVMYFAHSSVKAWDFVVNALRKANFRISATWPIHTENTNNPFAKGSASIMSSIVIVARKRKENKTGYIEEIKGEVETHLKLRLKEFWDYGLRGADITVAAMGATLDILTQYSEIKSYTGELTIKDILELVEMYVVEYILEKFLKNSEGLDSVTRFYIYCRLSELDGMSFDTANLISKSLNIDLKLLESAGNIYSNNKGINKGVKLLKFEERDAFEIKSLIDAVQQGMLSYDRGGMKEFESVLAEIPYNPGEIYNILESFKHLDSGDSEKQIAMQILGKSSDIIPERGQSTLDSL